MIGHVMLLQLGGLPNYSHSRVCKIVWGVWMLVVTLYLRPRSLPPCPWLTLGSTILIRMFVNRPPTAPCPPIHQVLEQFAVTFMAAATNVRAYASFEIQYGVSALPCTQLYGINVICDILHFTSKSSLTLNFVTVVLKYHYRGPHWVCFKPTKE